MRINNGRVELTATFLKYTAIITMLINHTCIIFMNHYEYRGFWYYFQWYVTRISFVLFAFLLSEGMYRTKNRYNYILRLAVFAIITELPYDYCFKGVVYKPHDFNTLFTLFLGAVAIELIEKYESVWKRLIVFIAITIIGYYLSYNLVGLGIILSFYFFRKKPVLMFFLVAILLALYYPLAKFDTLPEYGYNIINYLMHFNWKGKLTNCELIGGIFAFPLISLYKGEKGNNKLPSIMFYIIYPLHMMVLILLSKLFF